MSANDRIVEALVKAVHARYEFEYDECDHGTYRGGPYHGQPYAMCERWGSHIAEQLEPIIKARESQILREAADDFFARLPDGTSNGRAYNSYRVARMLRERADRIDAKS